MGNNKNNRKNTSMVGKGMRGEVTIGARTEGKKKQKGEGRK